MLWHGKTVPYSYLQLTQACLILVLVGQFLLLLALIVLLLLLVTLFLIVLLILIVLIIILVVCHCLSPSFPFRF